MNQGIPIVSGPTLGGWSTYGTLSQKVEAAHKLLTYNAWFAHGNKNAEPWTVSPPLRLSVFCGQVLLGSVKESPFE